MFRSISSLLFLTILSASCLAQEAGELSFGFHRTEAEHWLRSSEHISIQDVSGSDGQTENQTIQLVDEQYELREGRWIVTRTPRKAELWVDGINTNNQAIGLTVGIPITVTLDEEGRAAEATGFRKLMRRMEDELMPTEFNRVRERFNAQKLAAAELASWNDPIDEFAGETVKIGERWRYYDSLRVAGQRIHVTGIIRFDGWTEVDGVRGFKVLFDYDTHGAAVRKYGEGATRTLGSKDPTAPEGDTNLRLDGSDIRIVDPSSMQMVYRSKGYTMDLSSPFEGEMPGAAGYFENRSVERWKRSTESPNG